MPARRGRAQGLKRAALFPLFDGVFVLAAQLVFGPFMSTPLLSLTLVPLFGIVGWSTCCSSSRVPATTRNAWLSIIEMIVWAAMVLTVLGIQRNVIA